MEAGKVVVLVVHHRGRHVRSRPRGGKQAAASQHSGKAFAVLPQTQLMQRQVVPPVYVVLWAGMRRVCSAVPIGSGPGRGSAVGKGSSCTIEWRRRPGTPI